jgi:hypothetical protein
MADLVEKEKKVKKKNSMEIRKYHVECEFITPVLGTQPQRDIAVKQVHAAYIRENGDLSDEEMAALPDELEMGTTAFYRHDGVPCMRDYQIKGYLKETGRIFNGLHGVQALKSKITNLVFIFPMFIPFQIPEGEEITYNVRPMQIQTPMGPRSAVLRSEQLPVGTTFKFWMEVFDGQVTEDILRDLLSYGKHQGLLQWRNGSYGRFTFLMK